MSVAKKNTSTNEIDNGAPVIESINLEKDVFGLNQKTLVSATVSDPENDNITLCWHINDTVVEQNELWLSFMSIGDKSISLTATDSNGNSSTKTESFKVIDSDIGFGVWDDNIEIIRRSEVSPLVDIGLGRYKATGGGLPNRQYDFSEDMLVRGVMWKLYTPPTIIPNQCAIAWGLHQEIIDDLTSKFGESLSLTYSMPLTGDPAQDGWNLICGMQVEAHFVNDRTKVTYKVYRDGNYTARYESNYMQNN